MLLIDVIIGCTYAYCAGYITGVLEDAQVYSGHAGKKELDVSDVRLAVQTRVDHSFTTPPPRDVRALHFLSVSTLCLNVCTEIYTLVECVHILLSPGPSV